MDNQLRELIEAEDVIRAYDVYQYCMYMPTLEKYEVKVKQWLQDEHIKIYACVEGEMIRGVIVVLLHSGTRAEILGISVDMYNRGQGMGSYMIREIKEKYSLVEIIAETDNDAVAFYEKCGFKTMAHTEVYDGESVVRYQCVLS